MVPNGENIFQKTQKHRKFLGKARGIGEKLGVLVSTPQVPIGSPQVLIDAPRVSIGTQLNHGPITLFYVFGHFTGSFWLCFSLKKID